MNHNILKTFIFLFIACMIMGCSEPIGSFGGSGSGSGGGINSEYDFLMLRPKRILYDVDSGMDSRFSRLEDLDVFVADGGEYKKLNITDPDLSIEVVLNPGMTSESVTEVSTHFVFSEPGRHVIRGTYKENTDEYSIEVRGSFVNPGEGSDFVDIIWL